MVPIQQFQRDIQQLAVELPTLSVDALTVRLSSLFPDSTSFTEEQVEMLLDGVKNVVTTKKVATLFASSLPLFIVDEIIEGENSSCPDLIKAYVVIRSAEENELDAEDTRKIMKEAGIQTESYRYKIAMNLLKRNPYGFSYEVSCFHIQDIALIRRVAEVALYFEADEFYSNIREFDFSDYSDHQEFFLRGLIRSSDVAYHLIQDDEFKTTLSQSSLDTLAFLYTLFRFGESEVRSEVKKCSISEELIFGCIIRNESGSHFLNSTGFIHALESSEQYALLAMLLLFGYRENSDLLLKNPTVFQLLKEIYSLRDPTARFATVALILFLEKKGVTLISQMSHFEDFTCLYSICVVACRFFCPSIDPREDFKKKCKDPEFVKRFLRFLVELCLSEKLSEADRVSILSEVLRNIKLSIIPLLVDYTTCISLRLIKQLKTGLPPKVILERQFAFSLQQLGAPYPNNLTSNEIENLQYKEEIAYYAAGLDRLSKDEKDLLVPFFIQFLRLLFLGKMREVRYQTPEILGLSKKIDLSYWRTNSTVVVHDLLSRYPELSYSFEVILDLKEELLNSFQQQHIDVETYPEIFNYLNGESPLPVIDRRELNGSDKIKAVNFHLTKLLLETIPNKQIGILNQLEKYFPTTSDFRLDIRNWKKALIAKNEELIRGYRNYKVCRSDDPYLLFRIGSIAGETCQRVTGDPSKNKCLLAYPCDGKNQLLYVEAPDGMVEARAILRFFCGLHDKKRFPVLYLEPFYPSGTPQIFRLAMTLLAVECAKALGVPLVRHVKPKETGDFPFTLQTINGPAPFEYFDGTHSKVKQNDHPNANRISRDYINKPVIKQIFSPDNPEKLEL